MNLKRLRDYMTFDWNAFLATKRMVLNAIKFDEKSKMIKGEMVIIDDQSDEDNTFGKINFKIVTEQKTVNLTKYILKKPYHFSGIEKATVWGDMQDNLTIICKDLVAGDAPQIDKKA